MELLIDIHPTYMKICNFKKKFIKKTIIYSMRFIKHIIKLIKYIFKFILKNTLIYISKITPLGTKKKLIGLIYNYPKILFLAKKARYWLIKTENPNHVFKINLVVFFFIKNIFLYILRISLKHIYARSIILNEIRNNIFVRTELNKILKDVNLSKEIEISTFLLYRNENFELSYAEEEIYRDLKNFSTET